MDYIQIQIGELLVCNEMELICNEAEFEVTAQNLSGRTGANSEKPSSRATGVPRGIRTG